MYNEGSIKPNGVECMKKYYQNIIDKWLSNLLFDKQRDIFNAMTEDQKTVVLLALIYNVK